MDDLTSLRQQVRARRRVIVGQERERASQLLAERALSVITFEPHQHVGIFLSLAEEIDTAPIIERLWAQNVDVYLPVVIERRQPLAWLPYGKDSLMRTDMMGIPVPDIAMNRMVNAMTLDYVFMPLVGWDRFGHRLGMGGGFYDRTFADKISNQSPMLIGLAYDCQQIESITPQAWDVGLDALLTPSQTLLYNLS